MVNFLLPADNPLSSSWSAYDCTIELCTDGKYAVVDHSIQTTIALADTRAEASEWLTGEPMDNPVIESNWSDAWRQSKTEVPQDNAGCDMCGTNDRVPGSDLCENCQLDNSVS